MTDEKRKRRSRRTFADRYAEIETRLMTVRARLRELEVQKEMMVAAENEDIEARREALKAAQRMEKA